MLHVLAAAGWLTLWPAQPSLGQFEPKVVPIIYVVIK
jgi:hypothetical protein